MKTCPSCQTQYTDDTLRFCLQDGAVLEGVRITREQTISLAGQEMETVARRAGVSDSVEHDRLSEVTRVSPPQEKSGDSKLALAIGGLALAILLLGGVGALAIWFFYSGQPKVNANNTANKSNASNSKTANRNSDTDWTPTETPTASPDDSDATPTPDETPTPEIDQTEAVNEVSRQVGDWKSYAESGDLDSQIELYAPSVDYYRKRGANRDFVRLDRARAYALFDSISIEISNMNISVDDSGETATAAFDKEWEFEGRNRSTGKVRQELRFRKINGRWLISGEKDIKVYYTN